MIYASMSGMSGLRFSNSSPKPGWLVSYRPLAGSDYCRPPVAGSRCDEYSDGTLFARASSRRRRL